MVIPKERRVKNRSLLPTTPDALVEDINDDSGRTLQNAAKIPDMASFKARDRVFSLQDEPRAETIHK